MNASFPDLSAPEKMNPGMGTFFKNEFQEQGVQIALLSCYSNLIHPEPGEREKSYRNLSAIYSMPVILVPAWWLQKQAQSLPRWDIAKRIFQMRF